MVENGRRNLHRRVTVSYLRYFFYTIHPNLLMLLSIVSLRSWYQRKCSSTDSTEGYTTQKFPFPFLCCMVWWNQTKRPRTLKSLRKKKKKLIVNRRIKFRLDELFQLCILNQQWIQYYIVLEKYRISFQNHLDFHFLEILTLMTHSLGDPLLFKRCSVHTPVVSV